jgi:hypothetical protein
MWVDATPLRGVAILSGAGRHAGALLPASAACQIDFERARSKSSTTRCQTERLSISFTNAAFYAARDGLSTMTMARSLFGLC